MVNCEIRRRRGPSIWFALSGLGRFMPFSQGVALGFHISAFQACRNGGGTGGGQGTDRPTWRKCYSPPYGSRTVPFGSPYGSDLKKVLFLQGSLRPYGSRPPN